MAPLEKVMTTYEIRGVEPSDEEQLLDVARHLDTVNLPDDRDAIREIIDLSQRSFTGEVKDPKTRVRLRARGRPREAARRHVDDHRAARAPRRAVHLFRRHRRGEVLADARQALPPHAACASATRTTGPTEIGGLIVLPEYRKAPERLGQDHLVRALPLHRVAPRAVPRRGLAELLPPLETDGTSHLWEALGRHFTGLTYAEADKLSKKNKEFIKGLFPDGVVYASLLPREAQDVIGKVGAQTRGVEKLLRRIGFRYADRIDPFDGGPHFTAPTDEITLVAAHPARRALPTSSHRARAGSPKGLCAKELAVSPFIRIVMADVRDLGEAGVGIDADMCAAPGSQGGGRNRYPAPRLTRRTHARVASYRMVVAPRDAASPARRERSHHLTTASGASLAVEVRDPPRARSTAILLHSSMASRRIWNAPKGAGFAALLEEHGVRTLALDFRGHGESGTPAARGGRWNFDDLARDDLPALCRAARERWPRDRSPSSGIRWAGKSRSPPSPRVSPTPMPSRFWPPTCGSRAKSRTPCSARGKVPSSRITRGVTGVAGYFPARTLARRFRRRGRCLYGGVGLQLGPRPVAERRSRRRLLRRHVRPARARLGRGVARRSFPLHAASGVPFHPPRVDRASVRFELIRRSDEGEAAARSHADRDDTERQFRRGATLQTSVSADGRIAFVLTRRIVGE